VLILSLSPNVEVPRSGLSPNVEASRDRHSPRHSNGTSAALPTSCCSRRPHYPLARGSAQNPVVVLLAPLASRIYRQPVRPLVAAPPQRPRPLARARGRVRIRLWPRQASKRHQNGRRPGSPFAPRPQFVRRSAPRSAGGPGVAPARRPAPAGAGAVIAAPSLLRLSGEGLPAPRRGRCTAAPSGRRERCTASACRTASCRRRSCPPPGRPPGRAIVKTIALVPATQ